MIIHIQYCAGNPPLRSAGANVEYQVKLFSSTFFLGNDTERTKIGKDNPQNGKVRSLSFGTKQDTHTHTIRWCTFIFIGIL